MKSDINLREIKPEEAEKRIGQISGAIEGNKEEEDNDQFTINLGLNTQYPQAEYIDPTIIKSVLERAIDDLTHFQFCEALPVMLAVPLMLAPVPVITTVALLLLVIVTLALAVIAILLLPF